MAISSNYITLQRQIADELGDRQDLLSPLSDSALTLSPIQNAIQSAIAMWEREKFYFNELLVLTPLTGPYSWSTVAGQEYYSDSDWATPAQSTVVHFDQMWVLAFSQRYPLRITTSQEMIRISVNQATKSLPTDISFSQNMARLYPIPDVVYPIGALGIQRLTALSSPTDSNAWTQDGYDLIRASAKLILGREVLSDSDLEANSHKAIYGDPMDPRSRGYLQILKSQTTKRIGAGNIRPTYF